MASAPVVTVHKETGSGATDRIERKKIMALAEGRRSGFWVGQDRRAVVLQRHGISRVLASEGGRTSRGSIGNVREYVGLLNQLHAKGRADLDIVRTFGSDCGFSHN